jgi:hypothetical protein
LASTKNGCSEERETITDKDELRFGITLERFNAVMKKPLQGAQWSGIITAISTSALETDLVDGVVTLHGTTFQPKAVLATTRQEILEARGNKPVLSPVLQALHTAWKKNLKKLFVVGAACHVHVLRDFAATHPYLRDTELHVVGIPCTDNLEPAHLKWVFRHISRSPETVLNFEFMQDLQGPYPAFDRKNRKNPVLQSSGCRAQGRRLLEQLHELFRLHQQSCRHHGRLLRRTLQPGRKTAVDAGADGKGKAALRPDTPRHKRFSGNRQRRKLRRRQGVGQADHRPHP